MKYVYSTIRFVPDAVRGEFVNVGAIAGSDEAMEWRLRLADNLKRARALDDKGVLPAFWSAVDSIERRLDSFEASLEGESDDAIDLSESWLDGLWEESRNVIQFSRPAPILADDVDRALDVLFEEFIVDPEHRKEAVATKVPVLRATRLAYAREGIKKGPHLAERRIVSGPRHRQRFDFVVTNGRAVQLAHGWSFQRPDRDQLSDDIKAWAWTVQDIRQGGGSVLLPDDSRIRVPPDVDVEVVYLGPIEDSGRAVLNEALGAFKDVNATAVPVEQSDLVGRRAHSLLVHAGIQLDFHGD